MKIITVKILLGVVMITTILSFEVTKINTGIKLEETDDLDQIFQHALPDVDEYDFIEKSTNNLINMIKNNTLTKPKVKSGSTKKSNVSKKNTTIIISKAPYKISECFQSLEFSGKRIFPEYDYAKKVSAFFTMNANLLNVFENKNASKLVKSIHVMNIKKNPEFLHGSKNCLWFDDSFDRNNNITMCIENKNQTEEIKNSFVFFKSCLSRKKLKNKSKKSTTQQVNEIIKIVNTPHQKIYNLDHLRQGMAKDLSKKGFKVTTKDGKPIKINKTNIFNKKGKNKGKKNLSKKKNKKLKVPGTP